MIVHFKSPLAAQSFSNSERAAKSSQAFVRALETKCKTTGRHLLGCARRHPSGEGVRAGTILTQASSKGWGHLFKKNFPEDRVLRNEEVTSAAEAISVGVRLYGENRRTVAVEYFNKALDFKPTRRCLIATYGRATIVKINLKEEPLGLMLD